MGRSFLITLALLVLSTGIGEAACTSNGLSPATLTAASLSAVDVAACVTLSVSGDTINVPAGTSDWSGQEVDIIDKNITIFGAGEGQSIITCNTLQCVPFQIVMNSPGVKPWRISGFTIQFKFLQFQLFGIDARPANAPVTGWRIDHITMTNTSGAVIGTHPIWIAGIAWGLLDHLTFNGNAFYGPHLQGQISSENESCSPITTCAGGTYWNRPTNLGSDEAVYLEDCTFDWADATNQTPIDDSQYGGSLVVRHCTFNGGYVQNHSTGHENGKLGGFKLEVYNNTFTGNASIARWVFMRGGSGVFFNNTVTGYGSNTIDLTPSQRGIGMTPAGCSETTSVVLGLCNGLNAVDGNIEASGWPCFADCGRGGATGATNGAQQVNLPIYSWNNGPEATCRTGGACTNTVGFSVTTCTGSTVYLKTTGSTHSNGQVDYVNNGTTAKPGYTAYTYPHPLQGLGNQASKFKGASGGHRFTGTIRAN